MAATTDIETRHLGAHMVAYQQVHGTLASLEAMTSAVESWVVTMGFKATGPTAVEIVGEPSPDRAQEYDMEIQLPVEGTARAHPSDRVQLKDFAPTDAVVLTLRGPSDLMDLAAPLNRLKEWMLARDLQPGPTVRWVEVTDPAKVLPSEQITEVQYLLPRPG